MTIDVFESDVRPDGHFGAVFERDDETAYFYLLDLRRPTGQQTVAAYCVASAVAMPADVPARVTWTSEGDMAGLFLDGWLIAVFDLVSAPEEYEGREARPDDRSRFLDG